MNVEKVFNRERFEDVTSHLAKIILKIAVWWLIPKAIS